MGPGYPVDEMRIFTLIGEFECDKSQHHYLMVAGPHIQPHGWHTLDIECKGVLSVGV